MVLGLLCLRDLPRLIPVRFRCWARCMDFLPWQMFEARLVLESNVAALAAERATDEHVAELAEEVAEMYAVADGSAGVSHS